MHHMCNQHKIHYISNTYRITNLSYNLALIDEIPSLCSYFHENKLNA